MKKSTVWIIVVTTFLLFLLVGWLVPPLMGLAGGERWLVRGGAWLLGLIAALLMFFLLKPKIAATPAESAARDEIDVTVSAARNRLAAAKGKGLSKFGRLPVILVAGPSASAKTTVVARSGIEPELLAGEVLRGDTVVPTAALNIWFAQGNLVLEAGGAVAGDAVRWRRLIRHIQPSRLAAAFSRARQAPRVAVVCFGCDELLKPGASEAVPAAAQRLRARLAEVSQQIGIRLPVYVLFTKADRLPYWDDFMRNFTRDEGRDVLGATLTVPPAGGVGAYAEREALRLQHAFGTLFRGLALRRLDVLPRELQDAGRSGVYEFPREFRKISDLATQFLLDLCRPSQLGVSPFLRGFYFTGVRAVLVHDAGAPMLAQPQAAPGMAMDATGVFDARAMQQQALAMQSAQAGSRKVPEWAFLPRVFHDVILKDEVARGVTAGGTRVNLLRRAGILAAAAVFLVLAIGTTVSFFGNRRVLGETRAAMENARSLARVGPLPDLDALQRLEGLRLQTERLDRYARAGHPTRLAWGLYAGNGIQPDVRRLYFQRFDALLWDQTRNTLSNWLASLPRTPDQNSDYDSSYDALKAYLSTTSRPDSARADFLGPTLTRFWAMSGALDDDRRRLGQAQFTFYGAELPLGNPFAHTAEDALVERTRAFLHAFAGADQLYSYLLALARDSAPPIRWSDGTVRNEVVVPGEFSRRGWTQAQTVLDDVDRLLNRETWVVGEGTVPAAERARLQTDLRARYTADYVGNWTRFLQGGRIGPFSGVQDAAGKLRTLITNPSPLLRMIAVASDNTGLDSTAAVTKAFQPAHMLAAPGTTSATEAGGKYIGTLTLFQGAVEQVATQQGTLRDQAQIAANAGATQAKAEIGGLAVQFPGQGDAQVVGAAVRALLLAPISSAEAALGRVSLDELNGMGGGFCAPFRSLAGKFPFSPNSATEATVQEVADLLAPPTGAIFTFYDNNLQNLFERRGSQFVPRPGATPQPNPAFGAWLNSMLQASNALFNENVDGPQIMFLLRMQTSAQVPEVTVTFGRTARYTQTQPSAPPFEWNAGQIPARVVAKIDNTDVTVVDVPPGAWSIFRLFYRATLDARGGGRFGVTWRPEGTNTTVTGELAMNEGTPVFQAGWLSAVGRCVSQIVR